MIRTPDFADAMSVAAAERSACDAIVTRDPRGFRGSPVEAIDLATASAWIEGG